MNAIGQLLAIGAVSFTAAGGTYLVKGPPARTIACDPTTLKPGEICIQQIPEGTEILWVDARYRKDWQKNGLPGSVLWSLDPSEDQQAFEADIAARVLQTPRVIVYCSTEQCGLSHEVAQRIKALGLGAEVSVLRGGWDALREAGKVKDSNPGS